LQRITIAPNQIHNRYITLTPTQHHYLTRVLRLQIGGEFQAIDGTGQLYLCEITTESAQIKQPIDSPIALQPLILICALPKGHNFDDIVRACTELGVTTILPAISDRTLLNPSPQKLQRWRKIAQEATEQSERTISPTIVDPQSLASIFSQLPDRSDRYCCEARGEHPHLLSCLQSSQRTSIPIVIAIGPEGGWTDSELHLAIAHNFRLVSLGQHILRTITAPIVALSIVTAAVEQERVPKS
jgi:16S rRNA (uracil1498-N3)-methyltransferase